jgi:ganglioside-induced differentiation-associated protein 1
MIELYHHGSSVCAAKVRFVLAEKRLDWKGHYIDILTGEQFRADYMKLNPKAVVPTLVHDGKVVVESTVICEYLDEVFPRPALKPQSAYERAKMRLWTKAVDEDVHPACAEITFASCHRHIVGRLGPEGVKKFLDSTPPQSVTSQWHNRKKQIVMQGFDAPDVARPFRLYDRYLQKMEDNLAESAWLAGDTFSLADVGMTPYLNRLDMLGMLGEWTKGRPRLADWFERVKARPSFESSFLTWCPPDLTKDLKTFGTMSWPEVKRVLKAA